MVNLCVSTLLRCASCGDFVDGRLDFAPATTQTLHRRVRYNLTTKMKPPYFCTVVLFLKSGNVLSSQGVLPKYFTSCRCKQRGGAIELNFCVRYGNRWILYAIITGMAPLVGLEATTAFQSCLILSTFRLKTEQNGSF